MLKVVAILGTLDSKGAEFFFLKRRIEEQGVKTLVIDTGVLGAPSFKPDVSAEEVANAAGVSLSKLVERRDRGEAIAAMSCGAAAVVKKLFSEGRFHGIISMGGGSGTSIAAAAMRALPFGFPKLIVSTLASGDTRPIIDIKDIALIPSVVDVAGINRLSSEILSNAAGAIAGMIKARRDSQPERIRPIIAATMFGVTTPCVTRAREELERAGFEVLVFHAVGTGGRTMEELIRGGYVNGVLDITTTELADELAGGILSAGPNRLEAAGQVSIPQVVSLGALDMVNFAAPESIPAKYVDRHFYRHTPIVTLMRTTPKESAELGAIVAAKLNKAKGPTILMIPKKGVSSISVKGGPFYDPIADEALFNAVRSKVAHHVRIVEIDSDINNPAFAVEAASQLMHAINYAITE